MLVNTKLTALTADEIQQVKEVLVWQDVYNSFSSSLRARSAAEKTRKSCEAWIAQAEKGR